MLNFLSTEKLSRPPVIRPPTSNIFAGFCVCLCVHLCAKYLKKLLADFDEIRET